MVAPDAHLRRADPVMARLIDENGGPLPSEPPAAGRPDDPYGALVRAIAGQQLSVKAAQAIWRRLIARFDGRTPTPEEILADDPEELRVAAGFSRAKVAYLRSLAEHVVSGELELERLDELPDDEVIRELTAVKGIGEWSAHMFLMFTLHRPDVLAPGDLGIRNAVRAAYGLDAVPTPAELEAIAEPWRPYRTRAWSTWRVVCSIPKRSWSSVSSSRRRPWQSSPGATSTWAARAVKPEVTSQTWRSCTSTMPGAPASARPTSSVRTPMGEPSSSTAPASRSNDHPERSISAETIRAAIPSAASKFVSSTTAPEAAAPSDA